MLAMTKPRSPKTVCICVFFYAFGIGDFPGSSARKIYIFHLVAKSPLLVCHFQRLLLSSSFQQNWFYFIRTSIAKDVAFPVCEKEFLIFPIWFYNILLNYDVSLHNLVVLIVTIPTSPRLSKTEFICKSYGALILPLDLPRSWSGVSGHTGVSGPKRPESPVPVFSLPFVCCGAVLYGGPEFPRRRTGVSIPPESPSPKDRSLRSLFFRCRLSAAVRYCMGVRSSPGEGPESPSHRSLRPEDPESPAPSFSRLLCICVVRYW